MKFNRALCLPLALAALAVFAASCGGDSSDSSSTVAAATNATAAPTTIAPTTIAPTTAPPTTAAPATTTMAPTTTAAPTTAMAPATTTAAPSFAPDSPEGMAAEAWRVVFDSSADFADKAAHLEESVVLEATNAAYMEGAARFGGFKLDPTAVEIDGDTATVTYDVLFGETVQYTDLTGTLTLADGVWTVSRTAYCGFLASARTPCPN